MKDTIVVTEARANSNSPRHRLTILDLTERSNPSGSIIIVDANLAPYVGKPFLDMKEFFEFANAGADPEIHTLTITGVGSSAFGSVAFAWDVSTALGEPVAAIVPGYGLADVVPQALGGWFGFEMYDAVQSATQEFLANFAPTLAMIGRDLARSTPRTGDCADGGAGIPSRERRIRRCACDIPKCSGNHARDRPQQGSPRY
jgi:hypothetical protein